MFSKVIEYFIKTIIFVANVNNKCIKILWPCLVKLYYNYFVKWNKKCSYKVNLLIRIYLLIYKILWKKYILLLQLKSRLNEIFILLKVHKR